MVTGLLLIAAGLFVFRYASDIAVRVAGVVTPPPQGGAGNMTGSGFSDAYLPFIIWGFGFSLIGSGGAMLRSALLSPMSGGPSGGLGAGAGMASPEMVDSYIQQALASSRVVVPPSNPPASMREVVRIKCRNCGSLEAEDAAFCRKCGKPL
jgi:ribosomal protein L40E